MSLFVPARIDQEEILDHDDSAPLAERHRSLRDLRNINRYLGGNQIYRSLLRRAGLLDAKSVLLDIGTGTSDQPAALGQRLGTIIGLDFKIEHLLYGRDTVQERVLRVVGDATRLPFRNDSIDCVTSAHFFHHFSPDENVAILDECLRVSRHAVVVNDTLRSWIPLLFIKFLGVLRLIGPITRSDGPASVRRAYTRREARAVAQQTTARSAEVLWMFPWRMGLVLWKQI